MMPSFLKKLPFTQSTWFKYISFVISHFEQENCRQRAGSLTYTTMLSIVPIITVLLVIVSTVPALEGAKEQLQDAIYSNLLPSSSVQVSKYINDFAENSTQLTFVGIGFLFFTTIMMLTTIEDAFNEVWNVIKNRSGVKGWMRYWALITLGPVVFVGIFVVTGTVQSISFLNDSYNGYSIDWSFWIKMFSVLTSIFGFALLYWFIPNCRVPWKNALIAGTVIGLVFELLKSVFGFVMTNFTSYQAIYGAFAALPIFLLWIYLSWNLILIGVVISFATSVFTTPKTYPRHPVLAIMDLLNFLYSRHKEGKEATENELKFILGRKEILNWSVYIEQLISNNLIAKTEGDKYVLKKDLNDYTFWELYQNLPYPLPIRGELTKMQWQKGWMDDFTKQLTIIQDDVKHQLSVPLSIIFDKSKPRLADEVDHAPKF